MNIFKKYLVIGIIILFVGASIIPSVTSDSVEKTQLIINSNNTLYVDDDSQCPGNGSLAWPYCKIQYAIENASDEDTIRVYNGTYYEKLLVDKSINIIGNSSENTVVDGNDFDDIFIPNINITSIGVKIDGFNIINSGTPGAGILIPHLRNIIISNNSFSSDLVGIGIQQCDSEANIFIENNYFTEGTLNLSVGIEIVASYGGIFVTNNTFIDLYSGVWLTTSWNIEISENMFKNNKIGIRLQDSDHNTISKNSLDTGGLAGISVESSDVNIIICNKIYNFISGLSFSTTQGNKVTYNDLKDNEFGITVSLSFLDYIHHNNIDSNDIKELNAFFTVGWYPLNWWGSRTGPWFRVSRLGLIILFPWSIEEYDLEECIPTIIPNSFPTS